MSISTTTRTAGPFSGNDVQTTFAFTFKVFEDDDLVVVQADADGVETTLALGVGYTVTLNGDQDSAPGGDVILSTALPTGETLALTSDVAMLQEVVITNGGGFFPAVLNGALDRLTILVQQLAGKLNRSLRVSLNSGVSGAALELVAIDGGFIRFKDDATDGIETLTAAEAAALLGVAVDPATYTAVLASANGHADTGDAAVLASVAANFQPLAGNLTTVAGWSGANMTRIGALAAATATGFMVQTSATAFTKRSVAASTGLTVTNGSGVAGDPTLALDISALTEDTTPDAAADFLLTWDTSANAHKKVKPANLLSLTPIPQVIAEYRLSLGTNGSAHASGWVDRILNTFARNVGSLAAFNGNAVTLPAGTYALRGWAGFRVSGNSPGSITAGIRLRDDTAGVTIARGPNATFGNAWTDGYPGGGALCVSGVITLAAPADIKLQTYASGVVGMGVAVNSGDYEVYGQLEITRVS